MNKILAAVERTREQIRKRLEDGLTTKAGIAQASRALDMEAGEFAKFQEIKSAAMMAGTISLEEAQTIYSFLGEIPGKFNRQPVEVKVVLTQVFHELLKNKIQS